jgi:E3 ubiquitin-protein ligase DOA10
MNNIDIICKYCLQGASREIGMELVNFCDCRGSLKYTHLNCLRTWLTHSNNNICRECKTEYNFTSNEYFSSNELNNPQPICNKHLRFIRKLFALVFVSVFWSYIMYISVPIIFLTNHGFGIYFLFCLSCVCFIIGWINSMVYLWSHFETNHSVRVMIMFNSFSICLFGALTFLFGLVKFLVE